MKRLLYLTLTVLTVLATASCEKGGNKAKSPGAFSLKTEIAVFDKSFPLRYAWFFYSEPKDGYNIVFSDQPDFSALSESNYFAIDIPKSSCGTKMDVTTGLSSADERGEIPSDIRRGFLSEDALYNLLADSDRLYKDCSSTRKPF